MVRVFKLLHVKEVYVPCTTTSCVINQSALYQRKEEDANRCRCVFLEAFVSINNEVMFFGKYDFDKVVSNSCGGFSFHNLKLYEHNFFDLSNNDCCPIYKNSFSKLQYFNSILQYEHTIEKVVSVKLNPKLYLEKKQYETVYSNFIGSNINQLYYYPLVSKDEGIFLDKSIVVFKKIEFGPAYFNCVF